MEGVSDPELIERARNAGVITDYCDWRGQRVEVPAETLAAIVDVLDQPPAGRAGGSGGAQPQLTLPTERQWGFAVQLYSIRSRDSWGHGDLHDLASLARWSAAELGAGFVLINPLHAAEPQPPLSPSPYLPMTRLFTSPRYLRVEDILEYGALPAQDKRSRSTCPPPRCAPRTIRPTSSTGTQSGRPSAAAFELISKVPLTESRQRAYQDLPGRTRPRP